MCTVTFIRIREKIFITSNRDEKHWRAAAIPPAIQSLQQSHALFPKDRDAGGTWFAVQENGNAIVFLNGGWQKHIPDPPYRKSRGLILLDLIDQQLPYQAFLDIDLENIEPFTAIIWQDNQLFECRWDGAEKFHAALDSAMPHIWSSVTLYDQNTIAKRRQWFEKWIDKNPEPSQEDILHFHQFTGDGDTHNDLLMNRDNLVFTVSVTSAMFADEVVSMKYIDVREQKSHQHELIINKAIA
ncbi:MAG: NRDE family protein [Bacteroidetes bacterium]|nr:NRDE family protein [Bacteroidota bacterium]